MSAGRFNSYARLLGQGGEVFMLDMGEPVKIVDLAQDLIRLSGLEVGGDIDIAFTGMRPGEKMVEELFVPGEVYERTAHQKIFRIGNAHGFVPIRIDQAVARLEAAANQNDVPAIHTILQELLPRYQPWTDEVSSAPGVEIEPKTPGDVWTLSTKVPLPGTGQAN